MKDGSVFAALLLPVCACSLVYDPGKLPSPVDGGVPDGPMASACDIANLSVCPDERFPLIELSGAVTIDTENGLLLAENREPVSFGMILEQKDGGGEVLVARFERLDLVVGAVVTVVGSRPLVLVSDDTVTISGTLIGSAQDGMVGPGGDLGCGSSRGASGENTLLATLTAGSGGGGGGFGGLGGEGAIVHLTTGVPSPGGTARGVETLRPLMAGCSGGAAGDGEDRVGGVGGGGGGALQLVANGLLAISGQIELAGAGGGGAPSDATVSADDDRATGGGGGGGSGGALLAIGSQVTVSGRITANGGGGGEGARIEATPDVTEPAGDGSAGLPNLTRAAGGSATLNWGGNGGAGGSATGSPPCLSAQQPLDGCNGLVGTSVVVRGFELPDGGGGGGGSVGRIRLEATNGVTIEETAVISPPASTN